VIWSAFKLSLLVTASATLSILALGLAIAWLLARKQFPGKLLVETLVVLPLILPPTVTGYYLLSVLGRTGILGLLLGDGILFSWKAAVIASVVVGLPLMVQSARAGLEDVDQDIEDAARVDGATRLQVLRYVTFPMARSGIVAGTVLASARALGEFGATLMIAGNIPGRTQTLPLAIYDAVQLRQYDQANLMVLLLTGLAFIYLWGVYRLKPPGSRQAQSPLMSFTLFSSKKHG
jgi:molybdate transport system permease protein